MKPASLNELKKELKELPEQKLTDTLLRIAKYKKENKELLTYLLFEAEDEKGYVKGIKEEMDEMIRDTNRSRMDLAKKSIRKIVRFINKHIKFSGKKETEVELLIYFWEQLKNSGIRYQRYNAMMNLYKRHILKIKKAIQSLHEDLQYDYNLRIEGLED